MSERSETADAEPSPRQVVPATLQWRHMQRTLIALILIISAIVVMIVGIIVTGVSGWQNESPEARYRLARQALIEGEREVVLRQAAQLIQTPGYEPNGYLLRGLLFARAGKLDEAISNLQQSTTKEALVIEANTIAARCFYESGRFLQSIDAATIALHYDAKCLDARRWLAAAYYDLGAVGPAVQELQRISDEAPDDPGPDRLLGLIAKDGEQFATAITHYKKSLDRHPKEPERENVLQELAESEIKVGQFEDALATLTRCPQTATVLSLKSNCEIGLGHFDEAKAMLRDSLKQDPRAVPAMLALGKLLLDQGQADEGAQILTHAAAIAPQNSQVRFQLAQALRATGKSDAADNETRQMLEIQALEREFSDLHIKAGNTPTDAGTRSRIGELAILLGKPDLAKVWFRAALALDPNDARARSALTGTRKSSGPHAVK